MTAANRREREKKMREEEIIDAARKVFYKKGFYQASMDEIAAEAQFTKRTVYQYFVSKEDLYFAVALHAITGLFSEFEGAMAEEGTGLERIRRVAEAYYGFSRNNPEAFRLINLAQYISPAAGESPSLEHLSAMRQRIFARFAEVIRQGQEDGSIRGDFTVDTGVVSLFLLVTGFFNRLSETSDSYEKLDISPQKIAGFALDMIDRMIRA